MELNPKQVDGNGYSPSQVHAITGVPPPTLAKWEREFREYLQTARTKGGHKRFGPEVIERVERLKSLILDHGMTLQGARRHLEQPEETQPEELKSAIVSIASEWSEGRTELLDRLADRMADRMLRKVAEMQP